MAENKRTNRIGIRTWSKLKGKIQTVVGMAGFDIRRLPRWKRYGGFWLGRFDIRIILDIGANEGQFASWISVQFPNARILSFEPLKASYNMLTKRMGRNMKFAGFQIALGDHEAKLAIHRTLSRSSSSVLEPGPRLREVFPGVGGSDTEVIQMKRLDDVVKELGLDLRSALLIKMDVQGYEDRVIMGGRNTIAAATVVITEVSYINLYHEQALFSRIYSLLMELDFSYAGNLDQITDSRNGQPIQADAVFINNRFRKSV